MFSIYSSCNRVIVQKNRSVSFDGTQKEGISYYLQNEVNTSKTHMEWVKNNAPGDDRARILKISVSTPDESNEIHFTPGLILWSLFHY